MFPHSLFLRSPISLPLSRSDSYSVHLFGNPSSEARRILNLVHRAIDRLELVWLSFGSSLFDVGPQMVVSFAELTRILSPALDHLAWIALATDLSCRRETDDIRTRLDFLLWEQDNMCSHLEFQGLL